MTRDQIRTAVEKSFESGVLDSAETVLYMKVDELVDIGIKQDADSICYVTIYGEEVVVFMIVGKSVLAGPDAYKWLSEYHNHNPSAAKKSAAMIATYAANDIPNDGECIIPFINSKNKAWRSFRPLPSGELRTADDVRKIALLKRG